MFSSATSCLCSLSTMMPMPIIFFPSYIVNESPIFKLFGIVFAGNRFINAYVLWLGRSDVVSCRFISPENKFLVLKEKVGR